MTRSILHRVQTNRNKLAASLAILLLFLSDSSNAQERVLTLRDCIAIALGESPKLEASRLDLSAATQDIISARALNFPSLTASAGGEIFSGSSTGRFGIVNTTGPSGGGVSTNNSVDAAGLGVFGAKLQYPVFKDGSVFGLNDAPGVASKRAQKEALSWTAHLTREEVVYRITDAFLAVVSAQNRMAPIERRVSLLEQSAGITKEEQGKGLLLPIDVKLANEQLNGARSLSKIIHQQAVAGSLELTRSLGLASSSHIRLASSLPEPPEPPDVGQLLGSSLSLHPSVKMQQATITKARQDYRLERYRLYPSVSLTGSALYVSDFDKDAHVYTGAITVNVPIFDFGAQSATVRSKKYTYDAERAKLGSVADDVTNDVVNIYQQIYSLSENILTLQGEVGKLDRDARVATSQQQQGITPPLTTLDAELRLIGKRDDLDVLEARRLLLYAALQQAAGGTWKWLP